MKYLVIALLLLASSAFADPLCVDVNGNPVQGFCPDGNKSLAATTLKSTTVDMSTYTAFAIYCAAESKARLMPTSAKGTFPTFTVPAGFWLRLVTNKKTPFFNYSGACEIQGH